MFFFYGETVKDKERDPTKVDWNCNLSYAEGRQLMIEVYNYCKRIGPCSFEVSDSITITSPGKKAVGDYRVEVNGRAYTHKEMCQRLYSYVVNGSMSPQKVKEYLEEIYENGIIQSRSDEPLVNELKKQVFWISLQEDINYPMKRGRLGRKHPLFRYAEALILAQRSAGLGEAILNVVYQNADCKYPKGIQLLDTENVIAPFYYTVQEYLS